jgi:metal-responsive CopG/Arc/MetJ family transcriptional regulator
MNLIRTSVMLTQAQLDAMKKIAGRRGTTSSELIRLAITEFVRTEATRLKEMRDRKAHDATVEVL